MPFIAFMLRRVYNLLDTKPTEKTRKKLNWDKNPQNRKIK